MKFIIILAVLAVGSFSSPSDDWVNFKKTHGKKYKNAFEESYRMNIFLKNKALIDAHNTNYEKGLVTYHMKMNHFGDLTTEEYNAVMNKFNNTKMQRNRSGFSLSSTSDTEIPESIDWRQKGAVTPVKNQGRCGCCWAFSAVGSLEGQIFLKTGKLVSLSVQNLIDCSTENHGCNGGLMDLAFDYIRKNGGIDSEDSYPFEGSEAECRFKTSTVAGTVTDVVDLPEEDEEALQKAVATVGPISVAIDAGKASYQFYAGGLYYERYCSSRQLNHGVLVVGYGSEDGEDYWLVKNSWGAGWGERGYVKMARNRDNNCGIATMASYPIIQIDPEAL